jgi:hypothetical protein
LAPGVQRSDRGCGGTAKIKDTKKYTVLRPTRLSNYSAWCLVLTTTPYVQVAALCALFETITLRLEKWRADDRTPGQCAPERRLLADAGCG